MSKSLAADPRLLSVLIIAGPSAAEFCRKVEAMKEKRRMVLPAGAISHEGHGPDPAEIGKRIRSIAEEGTIDHLVIECAPEVPAMAYASIFLPQGNPSGPLTDVARLATTALAISPSNLLDALVDRRAVPNLASPCLIAEQLEFVDNVILDGPQNDPNFKRAAAVALTLNPRAEVRHLSPETLEKLFEDNESSFDFNAGLEGAGWRKLIDADEPGHSKQDNITAFAFRARRPFHAERFWALLQTELPGIFRAKGFFWLATRMDMVGGLNLAGSELHCAPAGTWWVARDDRAHQCDMPERTRKEWKEPFGDRRQAIAFMGIDFDANALRARLEACLLTDSEMAAGEEGWHDLADPFPSCSTHSHEHEHACGHEHGSEEHDCCHH
jgi:G3E family GTPase